jgi:methylmalonyl-CoA/ethylmalonyl-CoA epimerase
MNFHHIGIACKDIRQEAAAYQVLGYREATNFFSDPIQGVKGCFLHGSGPTLELLEDLPGSSTIKPWLQKGIKAYHLAFETPYLASSIDELRAVGGIIISEPMPSVAFSGRAICFIMLRSRQLIELIAL